MNEESVSFGSGLQGVHVRAGGVSLAAAHCPVFVMINAGFLHSVGPNRLYTDLSRRLAVYGFDSMRFDLPGIGNSQEASSSRECCNPQAASDEVVKQSINEALSMLSENNNARKFVLCGLCSGADDALEFARDDDRIAGIVAIDPAGFRTTGFYLYHFLQHYPRRIFAIDKWRSVLRTVLDRSGDRQLTSGDNDGNANDGYRKVSNVEEFRNRLSDILEKKGGECEILFAYTGGVAHYYNHEGQFKSMTKGIDGGDEIRVNYYPDSDHLLLVSAHREGLIKDTINWACSNLMPSDSPCFREKETDEEVIGDDKEESSGNLA